MRVHLHTVCWNDADRLEFFFRHYEPWVEHFWIHDDGSLDIIEARPDVTVLIRGDEGREYGEVMGIMKAVNKANITNVSLVTKPEP